MKKILKNLFKIIWFMLLAFLIFLVAVVAINADSYDEFFSYRKDNAVEFFLNREDGIGYMDMVQNIYAAYSATIDASMKYPDDSMMEDAYRHYTWNFKSTRLIGEEKTKLITDNHEIAISIRDMVDDTYEQLFVKYAEEEDFTRYFASLRAMKDTIKLLPEIRNTYVQNSRCVDASQIRDYYSSTSIMDFYNNELGRSDSLNYPDLDSESAFLKNEMIIKSYKDLDPVYYSYTLEYVKDDFYY